MRLELASLIDPVLLPLVGESRAFYARRRPGQGPKNFSELVAVREAMPVPAECQPSPSVETVSAGGRSVAVRIHTPTGLPATGVLLEIHTGGFYLGSAAGSDVRNRRLVDALGIAVVSVDYRLAPEHPWPAAPDDCETAALWLAENVEARFGTTRLVMSGFSAGSTLVTATLLRLRDRGIHAFGGAVVQCGTYDLSAQTSAGRLIADEYFLSAYVGDVPDRTVPDISPVFAELEGLPPILMVIGAEDVLFEDNLAMAARLLAAGVEVDLRVYPASPHAFSGHATSMAQAALETIERWLRGKVGETVKTRSTSAVSRSDSTLSLSDGRLCERRVYDVGPCAIRLRSTNVVHRPETPAKETSTGQVSDGASVRPSQVGTSSPSQSVLTVW